ncbi:MAG: glutaredoxin family protein [Polyangiaceae bacterium]
MTVLVGAVGCKRSHGAAEGSAAGSDRPLPVLALRDDTKDLLLTWVDASGDFHVVESIAEVPAENRAQVRVVVTTGDAGQSDPVYVADLRQKKPDQTYPVTTLSRSAWEELGATKRKARLEALAPVASQESARPAPSSNAKAEGSLVAVIYGAKWCGACREAKKYLAHKGVKVLEKDVDESPTVQAELRAKLARAKMSPTSSIPVIDIGGQILVGFSPGSVDAALQRATLPVAQQP